MDGNDDAFTLRDPHRTEPMTTIDSSPASSWMRWLFLALAAAGVLIVAWVCLTAWGAIVHGHPAYAILLGLTLIGSSYAAWRAWRGVPRRTGWRLVLRVALLVAAVAWIGAMAWLRPFTAVEPALAAMQSDATVTVTESPTQVVMSPAAGAGGTDASDTGVFFQPGALVEARAYAAVLRPLAEAGHTVVIAKQPLGIAFLALPAFDDARSAHPEVSQWVLGGHSLGGVVAAMQADASDEDASAPAVGLLLFASYPAGDISSSLSAAAMSISGTRDGLSTPEKIAASRSNLPADTTFVVIDGASHADFGDYGPQPGDGTPTITHDDARSQISDASVRFVDGLSD
jgi:Alpha/beta hydrolase family